MPVPQTQQHRHLTRGDESVNYDMTLRIGNTTVNIVAPPPMTEEEKERILDEFHAAGWAILEELEGKAG